MAARRCVLHGSFPTSMEYMNCPVCGEHTDYITNDEPDEHWESNIARQQEHLIRAGADIPEIPTLEGAKVHLLDGQYFISTWDVVDGGVRHQLRDTDLVRVGKQVFEVLAYSYDERRYWVTPFSLELSDEDLCRLAGP